MEEKRTQLLQQLLKRLGHALHGSVVGSEEVRDCLRQLHEQGCEAVMVLEASLACRHGQDIEAGEASLHVHTQSEPRRVGFRMNLGDAAFLASLGISPTRHRTAGAGRIDGGGRVPGDRS